MYSSDFEDLNKEPSTRSRKLLLPYLVIYIVVSYFISKKKGLE